MHWIGHYLTFDQIPSDHLDDTKPLVSDINQFATYCNVYLSIAG